MAKDDKNIWIFIGIAVLILGIIIYPQIQKQDIVTGISATYYDNNGSEIKKSESFSFFSQEPIVNNYVTLQLEENISSSSTDSSNFWNKIKNLIGSVGIFGIVYTPIQLIESTNVGYNKWHTFTNTRYWFGQTFILGYSSGYEYAPVGTKVRADYATLVVYKEGATAGTLTASIRATSGDIPTGSDLPGCVGTYYLGSLPDGDTNLVFSFSTPCELTVGVKYALLFKVDKNVDDVFLRYKDSGGYDGGGRVRSVDSGQTFFVLDSADYTSALYGRIPTCVPETCTSLGKTCGTWDDGCGEVIVCGPDCPGGGTFGNIYQENANITTINGSWTYPEKLYDGSWSTYGYLSSGWGSLTLTYIKPLGATSMLWQVKDQNQVITNLTVSAPCFNYYSDKVVLRLDLNGYNGGLDQSFWRCAPTGETFRVGTGHTIYEEGVWWNIPPPLVKYQINVVNNGGIPYYNVKIDSTSPSSFLSYFPNTKFNLSLGQSNNFTSELIDISSYVNQTFTAYISGLNTYTNQTQTFTASKGI